MARLDFYYLVFDAFRLGWCWESVARLIRVWRRRRFLLVDPLQIFQAEEDPDLALGIDVGAASHASQFVHGAVEMGTDTVGGRENVLVVEKRPSTATILLEYIPYSLERHKVRTAQAGKKGVLFGFDLLVGFFKCTSAA